MSGECAVPFCDLARAHAAIRSDINRAIRECIDTSQFLRGAQTQAFEEEWAAYCGQRFAVTCNSGTDALTIAASALGMEHARVPANTLPLTAIGLHRGGVSVEIVDVDDEGWPKDPDAHTVRVLLYGRLQGAADAAVQRNASPPRDAAQMRDVSSHCNAAPLCDAAHAHGWKPPHGTVAAWSFYPTKTLGALGDGGAVTTDDEGLADLMRDLCGRDDQLRDRRQVTSRMDELQAAVLRVKLRHLDAWLAMRRQIGDAYDRRFKGNGLSLPGPSLHHLYCIRAGNRDALAAALLAGGIVTKVHWSTPLSRLAGPWRCPRECPGADRWCAQVLSLPCYPGLAAHEVDRVAAATLAHAQPV